MTNRYRKQVIYYILQYVISMSIAYTIMELSALAQRKGKLPVYIMVIILCGKAIVNY